MPGEQSDSGALTFWEHFAVCIPALLLTELGLCSQSWCTITVMNEHKKISRGEFLKLVGGMALAVAFFKLSSVEHALAVATNPKRKPIAAGSYGNSSYGGKKA